jgi:phosphoglucosamine mutase
MARKFFGTDGIRGRTNAGVMTAAIAMRVGQAAGRREPRHHRPGHRHFAVLRGDLAAPGSRGLLALDRLTALKRP